MKTAIDELDEMLRLLRWGAKELAEETGLVRLDKVTSEGGPNATKQQKLDELGNNIEQIEVMKKTIGKVIIESKTNVGKARIVFIIIPTAFASIVTVTLLVAAVRLYYAPSLSKVAALTLKPELCWLCG